MIARFEWSNARTINDALGQLGDKVLIKAGGIDVIDRLKEGIDSPARLVNIRTLQGLDYVREDAGGLRIGPLVTLAQLDNNKLVRTKYTALAEAAAHAATPQIRNMATIGGNLLQRPRCWYFRNEQFHCRKKGGTRCFAQDGENEYHAIFNNRTCAIVHPSALAVALIALDGKIEVTGKRGKREVLLEEFFISPERDIMRENTLAADEIVTEIRVPAPHAGSRSAYMKQGEKESFDWPIAEVAVMLEPSGANVGSARIVLGAAAPVPLRAKAAEAALAGKPVTEDSARAAAAAALQGATPLSQNSYKVPVLETIVRRTILAAKA